MIKQQKILLLSIIGISPFLFNGIINSQLKSEDIFLYWTIEILFWVILPISIYLYAIKTRLIGHNIFGSFKNYNIIRSIIVIILISIGFYVVFNSMQKLSFSIFSENYFSLSFHYKDTIPANLILKYIVIFYHSITAGLIEEFYYRGMLRKAINGKIYILISSLIFAVVHWENGIYTMFPAFFVGLFAATVYYKQKILWPLIIGHTITDFIYFTYWSA